MRPTSHPDPRLATDARRARWRLLCSAALVLAAGWLLVVAAPDSAFAQDGAGPPVEAPATDDAGGSMTLIDLFRMSPLINSIILGLSVVALIQFTYFMVAMTGRNMAPAQFVSEVNKLIQNQDYKEAADYCRKHQHLFAATIVQRCVENTGKPHSVIMTMINNEGQRRADIVWNRISYLADVSNVAPMLGLLGTVLGMIKAFYQKLPEGSASISSGVLSRAIGEAMATTMFGLVVGIVALTFYSIVKGRVTQALAEAEQVVHSIADHLKRDDP